jgi:hypothetical protein
VHYKNVEAGFFRPKVCTMATKDNLLIAGGLKGEIICKVVHSSSSSTSFPISDVTQIIPAWSHVYLRAPLCILLVLLDFVRIHS